MLRRIASVMCAFALFAGGATVALAGTREAPDALTPAHVAHKAREWTGTVAARGQDSYWFVARLDGARTARVTTWIHWGTSEDLAVQIFDAGGTRVGSSNGAPGEDEIATFDVENGKTYEVRVTGGINLSTPYEGYLWVRHVRGRDFKGPGKLTYKKKDIFATLDIPINVVFVGFDKAEVDQYRDTLNAQLPPAFRPAIRIGGSSLGGSGLVRRDGGPSGRQLLELTGSRLVIEPVEYRYKYNLITAPESYSKALFAAAKAATTSGEYELPFDREFIERYNARSGALRGADHAVAPNSPIDFVDGIKVEDWIAKNPPAGLDFDLSKPANGYTYFVIDSFRPSYAKNYFNPNRYHNFKVSNALTKDPDSGGDNGFDWGRVWGGRYRFLMLDVGAAPNAWEAAHYPTTKIFRVSGNGDSSLTDPPIWHSTATGLADFYERIGEDVQYAIWMRFTRGYLYRPRAYDKFILAANTWHDEAAYTPWPSKLEMLYKDKLVQQAYQDLLPYVEFDGFSKFKYLSPGDPEQNALDEGKNNSMSRAPVPFAVNTNPTMLLINQNRGTYAPLEPGAFTIPVVNVVFPSLYTWSLPAIVGGIAEGEGGEAWGQLQNVNNRTKWPGATQGVTDSKGNRHEPTVPDSRQEGIDNIARFGFTATALHEAGHFLGLSHNHDAVAYDWRLGDPDKAEGYYEAIDWMYTTTASPMSYGWEWNKFEVLDKDNVWIGHALEWLTEAQDNLVDAYAALDQKRFTAVPANVASAQSAADALMNHSIASMKGGDYLAAVIAARNARDASRTVVSTAAASVLGVKAGRKPAAPRGADLPATGVGGVEVAAVLLATALALGVRLRRTLTVR